MGTIASEHAQKLFAANNYKEYLYFHGLGVEEQQKPSPSIGIRRSGKSLGFPAETPWFRNRPTRHQEILQRSITAVRGTVSAIQRVQP